MCAPRPGGAKEGFSWFGRVWAATALGRVGLEGSGRPPNHSKLQVFSEEKIIQFVLQFILQPIS